LGCKTLGMTRQAYLTLTREEFNGLRWLLWAGK
jgi:hypothetical protein